MLQKKFQHAWAEHNKRRIIVKSLPDGTVTKLAQNGDKDGFNGELDEPGEPIVRNGNLIISCFDTVTNDIVVNSMHELPAILAQIEL